MRPLLPLLMAFAPAAVAGEDALAPLLERLRAGEPGATARLAQVGLEAVGPLFDLLGDPDPQVAWRARSALRRLANRMTGEAEKARLAHALVGRLAAERPLAERRAAAELLGRVGSSEHVETLAPLLDHGALFDTAARALARIPGDQARSALVNALATPRPPAQAATLIELLANRGEAESLDVFQAAATVDNDLVRAAAARAIAALGEPGGAQTLLELLEGKSQAVRAAALEAAATLARALHRKGRASEGADLLRQSYAQCRDETERALILADLAAVAGQAALDEVERALRSRDPALRHAAAVALRALRGPAADEALLNGARNARGDVRPLLVAEIGRRGIASATPLLLEAAGEKDETLALCALAALGRLAAPSLAPAVLHVAANTRAPAPVKAQALRLALRLAHSLCDAGQGAKALAVFARALTLSTSQNDRRSAVIGLGRTARPEALDILAPVLDNPDDPQRELALRACVAVGQAAERRGERASAVAAYRRALDAQPGFAPAITRLALLGIHPEMATLNGCIATWWVIAPFPCGDLKEAPHKSWFPEEEIALGKTYEVEGRTLRWRLIHSDHEKGWMLLRGRFRPGNRVLAYAYTTLMLPRATDAVLAFGRDDGLTLWVNGQELYNEHGPSAIGSQEHTAHARLVAGENHILVKNTQGGGDWGFYLRLTTPDGKPLATD